MSFRLPTLLILGAAFAATAAAETDFNYVGGRYKGSLRQLSGHFNGKITIRISPLSQGRRARLVFAGNLRLPDSIYSFRDKVLLLGNKRANVTDPGILAPTRDSSARWLGKGRNRFAVKITSVDNVIKNVLRCRVRQLARRKRLIASVTVYTSPGLLPPDGKAVAYRMNAYARSRK